MRIMSNVRLIHAPRCGKTASRAAKNNPRNVPAIRSSEGNSNGSDTKKKPLIFIVEDNPSDVFVIKRALAQANVIGDIQVAEDGAQAVEMFDQIVEDCSRACPALILLDINLPMLNGLEVLKHMRQSARCNHIKILMVTTSDIPEEREVINDWDAEYFQKPVDMPEFMRLGVVVQTMLGRKNGNSTRT